MKGTIVQNIVDSTKKFVKDHKPEIINITIAVSAVVATGAYFTMHRHCINFTDGMVKAMETGDMVVVEKRGKEYAMALYQYLPKNE